ncbi:hypothetical protein [Streptacidiphilus melanogenes]|uniref:hypothetical protein n=1 Tax=Streptacidiphilus melanogenes TaxID=411235 RepID=UPI001F30C56F|nr:hypothetical protein [Streptacidiphilus melanogenes]
MLKDLSHSSNISVNSSAGLAGSVEAAAAEVDRAREEKAKSDGKAAADPPRRKPSLSPIPEAELDRTLELAPWTVLHSLGRAMALSHQGAGRGLAEHWGCLKYTQALVGGLGSFLALSDEGRDAAEYYKALQSRELGFGFACTLSEMLLRRQYPTHSVSIVPAETALRAGWALTGRDKGPRSGGSRYRPRFFAEVWRPGEASRVIPIACKGNHSDAATSHEQLASASAHVEAVHIGDWNETPALVFSTEIPTEGPLTVHALQAKGTGGWLQPLTHDESVALNHEVQELAIYPGIRPPADEGAEGDPEPGYQVLPPHFSWFTRVLGRTSAAGIAAFAGDGETTARYLTKRQGRQRFTGAVHAATGSVQDAAWNLLDAPYVGTDHVFRLNGTRVEAFSGVEATLLGHLATGNVEEYRHLVHARRSDSQHVEWDPDWRGPVSVHSDGSVLALRVLPQPRTRARKAPAS